MEAERRHQVFKDPASQGLRRTMFTEKFIEFVLAEVVVG
jgi:hypothetical protein